MSIKHITRIAIAVMVMVAPAFSQTTPNLSLTLPVINSPGWGVVLNNDFSIIDAFAGITPNTGVKVNVLLQGLPNCTLSGYVLSPQADGCILPAGSGTVTSVGVTVPPWASTSGSPVTGSGTIGLILPPFTASGSSHAAGIVPDPGATAGSVRFLNENGTWLAPPTTGASFAFPGINYANSATAATLATPLQLQNSTGLYVHTNGYVNNSYSPQSCILATWPTVGCFNAGTQFRSALAAATSLGAYLFVDPAPTGQTLFIDYAYIGDGEGGIVGGGHHYQQGSVIYQVPGASRTMIRTDPALSVQSYLDYYLIEGMAFYGDMTNTSTAGKCVDIEVRMAERSQFNRSSCNHWPEDGWYWGEGSDPFFVTDLEGSGDGYAGGANTYCGIHLFNPGGNPWNMVTINGWSADNDYTAGICIEHSFNYSSTADSFRLLSGKVETRLDDPQIPGGEPIAVYLNDLNGSPVEINGLTGVQVALNGGGGTPISTASLDGFGTLTVNVPISHVPPAIGTNFLIAGNSQSSLNGVFTVTGTSSSTITASVSGSAITGGGGNVYYNQVTDSLIRIAGSGVNLSLSGITVQGGIDAILGSPFGYYNIIHDTVNSFTNNLTVIHNDSLPTGASWREGTYNYPLFCTDNGCKPITASLTTGSGTTDTVSMPYVTTSSHCTISPTNSAALAATQAGVTGKSANSVTVTHAATSGLTYDIYCSAY